MDETAVFFADDNTLKNLGLKADGDIIRLRILCSTSGENINEKMRA